MLRRTIVAAAAGAAALLLVVPGCGSKSRPELKVQQVAQAGPLYQNPLDAVPGRDGIYFTADGPAGPGVFVAPAAGEPRAVATGRPFRRPVGIAISTDEATIFVADTQADAVFAVPAAGGAPVALTGSAGLAPRGLEVKGDQLYVSGVDPKSGSPAVLRMPTAGGQPTVLAAGLTLPDGIAVADDGTVFVSDRFPGSVGRITGGKIEALAGTAKANLGQPAGIALGANGNLLVSAVNPSSGAAEVLILDPASGKRRVFDDVIGKNHGAGGLHRANDGRSYAWCDVSRSGRVYRIEA